MAIDVACVMKSSSTPTIASSATRKARNLVSEAVNECTISNAFLVRRSSMLLWRRTYSLARPVHGRPLFRGNVLCAGTIA